MLVALDEQIDAFLLKLSIYFLAPPAFKALEYLIRRFRWVVRKPCSGLGMHTANSMHVLAVVGLKQGVCQHETANASACNKFFLASCSLTG